jgi:hypothetical protein
LNTEFKMQEWLIKPSRYRMIFILILHILAVFAVFITQLLVWVQIILTCLVLFHFILLGKWDVRSTCQASLSYIENVGWQLGTEKYQQLIEIQPSSVVTSFLIVIYYRLALSKRKQLSLVIFPDSLDSKEFKRLLVQLKISAFENL